MSDINTPTGGDSEKNQQIQEVVGEKKDELSEALFGNKEAILKDLKDNYVKIEENAEMMGYEGKKVHINLPAVGNFEGFEFDYFVSDNKVSKYDFEKNSELEKKSYSMKEIGELLKAMNVYMKAMGVETDGDMDYENDLKSWRRIDYKCNAGFCLMKIAGILDDMYWLKDKDGQEGLRAFWDCRGIGSLCCFDVAVGDYGAKLFLRLSD